MRLFCLGIAGGAALLQQQAALPSWGNLLLASLIVAGMTGLPSLLSLPTRWRKIWRYLLSAVVGLTSGFFWAALQAYLALQPALHALDEGRDVRVSGLIESLPYPSGQGQRFNFRIEQVLSPTAHALPTHVALGWYVARSSKGAAPRALPLLAAGQRWQFTVRLQRPHGNANPYGFDYEVWLLEQGLRATGYVRTSETARLLDRFVPCIACVIEALRGSVRSRIEAALAGRRYHAVIVALVVGDQHGISAPDWQVFTRTGVSHLISISGLHVTMLAGLIAALAGQFWRRSFFTGAQLALRLPAQKVAALAGALAAWGYVLLAGYAVPAKLIRGAALVLWWELSIA